MRKGFKKILAALTAAATVLTLTPVSVYAASGLNGVVINEICSSNKKSLKDGEGDSPDWIELYNSGSKPVSLKGCSLSDDKNDLKKWTFPDISIGAGKYLIVFASDKDLKKDELHTNFKLSGGNDTLFLSDAQGSVVEEIPLPETTQDETYGRLPNGSGDFKVLSATPGKGNDSAKSTKLASPIFSDKSGFYDGSFKLTISASKGTTIYYTTDGSLPSTGSKKYSSPITVSDRSNERATLMFQRGTTVDSNSEYFPSENFPRGTVIRAIAVDSNGKKSDAVTATYFIGSSFTSKFKNVAVISVTADPKDLHNSKTGIFVAGNVFSDWRKKNPSGTLDGNTPANFNQRGREWEREVHIDFFVNLKQEFSTNAGMRVQGGWSRNNQQKSMKFYMRSEYGDSNLDYKLFEGNLNYYNGKTIKNYKRFMLRNGGNDQFSLKFKCPWTQSLVTDLEFATQDGRLAVCFLNGEYWGMYTLNDVYDDSYVEQNYGVPEDDVILVKVGELEEGVESDFKLYQDAVKFIENSDMTKEDNYQKACELFDIQSLLDYFATEIYIGNQDWIWNNWACWRSRTATGEDSAFQDGKWRFMLYDTEYSMDLYGVGADYKFDLLKELVSKKDGHFGKLFSSLMKNKDFKQRFIITIEKVANVNFNPQYASNELTRFYNEYSPYLKDHFKRFIGWQSVGGISNNVAGWKKWLTNRRDYLPTMLKNDLSLSSASVNSLSLSVSSEAGGDIYLEGIKVRFTSNKWEGKFLPGYKIVLKAEAKDGYVFTGWSGDFNGKDASIRINPTKKLNLKANFAKKK